MIRKPNPERKPHRRPLIRAQPGTRRPMPSTDKRPAVFAADDSAPASDWDSVHDPAARDLCDLRRHGAGGRPGDHHHDSCRSLPNPSMFVLPCWFAQSCLEQYFQRHLTTWWNARGSSVDKESYVDEFKRERPWRPRQSGPLVL